MGAIWAIGDRDEKLNSFHLFNETSLCNLSINQLCSCKYLFFILPVHPCDKKTYGGCEQKCNKDGDNAKCSCEPAEDFTLNGDGQTCDKSKDSKFNPVSSKAN